ncbi:hypothetical protein GCM10027168_56000 [Streptomyces capparidis]
MRTLLRAVLRALHTRTRTRAATIQATPGPHRPARRRNRTGAQRKQARKRLLARRDGMTCTYCRTPFPDLTHATVDHVVPRCLYPTGESRHLVLACLPCNHRKADRLPLSMALILCATIPGHTPYSAHPHAARTAYPDRSPYPTDPSTPTPVPNWPMLARLAAAVTARSAGHPADHGHAVNTSAHPPRSAPDLHGAPRPASDPKGGKTAPVNTRWTPVNTSGPDVSTHPAAVNIDAVRVNAARTAVNTPVHVGRTPAPHADRTARTPSSHTPHTAARTAPAPAPEVAA